VPGGAVTANGPDDEEQLSPDLELFSKNMKQVDAARSMQSQNAS